MNVRFNKFVSSTDRYLFVTVAFLVFYLAVCTWFDLSRFEVFAGDDLRSFAAAKNGFAGFNQMMISFYKFRPVAALLFGAVARWTHCDFRAVANVALMLHTINGVLFFYLLYQRIRVPLFASSVITVVAVFNRFATYVFMQDAALTMGLAVAVFLLILIICSFFLEKPTISAALGLAALYAAIIYTYEAFLSLAFPLLILAILSFRTKPKPSLVLSAGVITSLLSNVCIKTFVIHTPILIGTETRPIHFHLGQISAFVWSGMLNLAGLNVGPTYLSLENFAESPRSVQIVSIAAAALSFSLVLWILQIILSKSGRESALARPALLFYSSTIFALLLSASITFRQIYAWLYPAYLTFLVFLGFAMQVKKNGQWCFRVALTCLLLLSLGREIYLARRHSQFFAFQVDEVANNLFRTLRHVSDLNTINTVLIRGDVPAKEWTFLAGEFSRFYHLPALEFVSRNSPEEQTDDSHIVLDYVDANRSFRLAREPQIIAAITHRMSFSALQPSAADLVPSDRWSTPTRTPEFPMSKNGVDCMIEVAPIELSVDVPRTARTLHVCFSHVYAIGDGASIEIVALTPTGAELLLSRRVPPLVDNDFPVWRKYEFTLPTQTRQIKLRVLSEPNSAADWIAVRDFSFD